MANRWYTQFYGSLHKKPVQLDCNFVVDSTNANGLGIRSLKGPGISNVFMNAAVAPANTPAMGTSRTYGAFGATAVTNTGNTVITGNLGISPGTAVTGFPPGTFSGVENVANAAALVAKASAQAAYTDLQARSSTVIASALDGQTLTAGVYSFASGAATLAAAGAGTLTLSGSATDVFVIKTATTLITGAGGIPTITLSGGALASNVYWAVGSSATLNSGFSGTFKGNVIANTSITVTLGGTVNGSLIALNGAVTFSAATAVNVQAITSAVVGAGNPNPAPGYVVVQFQDNFNRYFFGTSGFVSPLSGTNISISGSSVMTVGVPYVITSVGTSTQANWRAVGLPSGMVPAAGEPFIASVTGGGTGTGVVQAVSVSGVNSMEVVGDPQQTLGANFNGASLLGGSAGSYMMLQCLSSSGVTAPTNETVIGLSFFLSNSFIQVQGE